MLHTLAKRIIKSLLDDDIITIEYREVYVYGMEVLLSSLFSTLVIILIGAFCSKIFETLVFIFVFIGLRSFTGGYHADRYWLCTVTTLLVYISIVALSECINVSYLAFVFMIPLGLIVLITKAPIQNPNKHLLKKEIKRHKIISIIVFLSFSSIGIISALNQFVFTEVILFTLIADLILLFFKTKYVINK